MQDELKTKDQLLQEMAALSQRVADLEKLEIEYKRIEGKLRESERSMQGLLNSVQAALFMIDTAGTILALNETIARGLGKRVDELLGARIQDFLAPDLAVAKRAHSLEVIRSGKAVQFEDEFKGMWTENTIHPIFDDQGNVTKLAVFSRDVTAQRRAAELQSRVYEELEKRVIERRADLQRANEKLQLEIAERKRVEEEMRESQQLLKKTFASLREAVFIIDEQTVQIIDCNPAVTQMFGYSREELLGQTTTLLHVDESFRQDFRKRLLAAIEDKGFLHLPEFRMRHKNGEIFFTEHTVMPLEDDQGGRIGWVSVVRDITERKQAEEALRKSEAKYRLIADRMNDIVWTIDQDLHTTYVSPSIKKVLGFTPEERMTQEVHTQVTPASLSVIQSTLTRELENEQKGQADPERTVTLELEFNHKDGSVRWLESVISIIRNDQGILSGFHGVSRDVTDRKKGEEALRYSSEQLRSLTTHLQTVREEERGRIAREVHDELGQVLTGLKMDLSWLASRLSKNQEPLLKKTKSMSELVHATIQTVRKISSELRPGILDDLGLSAAIEWQAQEFENRTGIKCRFISSREDFSLDKERSTAVFRLFQEALTNVARHAEATRVDINLEERAGHLILKVHDNGKGITQRQISHSKSLGLLGMRERALLFQGEVKIEGRRGKGTTVTVQIPTGEKEAGGSQAKGERQRENGKSPKRKVAGKRR